MGRIGAEAAAAGDQVGGRRAADTAVHVAGAHLTQHPLRLFRERFANAQIVRVITDPDPGDGHAPLVLDMGIEGDETVVGGQPVAEHLVAQVAPLGEFLLQPALQARTPDQPASVVPFERVGAGDGIGMAEQEVDGAALDAPQPWRLEHVPVLQAAIDEGPAFAQGLGFFGPAIPVQEGPLAAAAGREQQIATDLAPVVTQAMRVFRPR